MYIFNTTFIVEQRAHDRWLKLLREHYIPSLQQGGFSGLTFTKLLDSQPAGHHTYSLQVPVDSIPDYRCVHEELFAEFWAVAPDLFGEDVLWVNSLLKKVE